MSKSNEATEKVKRIPPKRPVVVSGTFAEGHGVFFKFKQSSQTTFEGVHELVVTFAVPSGWDGGGVRVSGTARGHKPRLWMDQPTIFGHVDDAIEFYPAGKAMPRDEAAAARPPGVVLLDGGRGPQASRRKRRRRIPALSEVLDTCDCWVAGVERQRAPRVEPLGARPNLDPSHPAVLSRQPLRCAARFAALRKIERQLDDRLVAGAGFVEQRAQFKRVGRIEPHERLDQLQRLGPAGRA